MNEDETRGQLIARLREDHLWTREELAKRAGVTPTTVTQAESGRTHVRLKTIGKLAEALGVPASRLLRPTEERELATAGKGEAPKAGPVTEQDSDKINAETIEHAIMTVNGLRAVTRKQAAAWRKTLEETIEQGKPLEEHRPDEWTTYALFLQKLFLESFVTLDRAAKADGLSSPREWSPEAREAIYEAGTRVQVLADMASRAQEENDRLRSDARERVLAEEFSVEELPETLTGDPLWSEKLEEARAVK